MRKYIATLPTAVTMGTAMGLGTGLGGPWTVPMITYEGGQWKIRKGIDWGYYRRAAKYAVIGGVAGIIWPVSFPISLYYGFRQVVENQATIDD